MTNAACGLRSGSYDLVRVPVCKRYSAGATVRENEIQRQGHTAEVRQRYTTTGTGTGTGTVARDSLSSVPVRGKERRLGKETETKTETDRDADEVAESEVN